MNFQSDWFQDQSEVMDYMDLDEVEEVPDTPDRYIRAHSNDANSTGKRSDGSSSCRVIDREYFNERFRNEPREREKEKSVNIRGSRRLFVRPDNASNSPGFTIGNSPSCKNILSTLDNVRHERGKSLCNSSSFVDLTEHSGRSRVFGKATSTGDLGTAGAYPYKKHLYSGNGVHAVDALDTSSNSSGLNNTIKVGPRCDREKGVAVALSKDESDSSLLANSPLKVTRHRRLVKNGYISPNNIEKSKQVEERHVTGRVANNLRVASDGPSSTVDINNLVAETKDSRRFKGKGVSHYPSLFEEHDARNKHLSQRSSAIFKETSSASKDLSVDPSTCFKESEGWISTHNHMRKVDPTLLDGDQHISSGKATAIDQLKNETVQRDHRNDSTSSNLYNCFEDLEIDSIQRVSAPPDTMSRRAHNLGQFKERAQFTKRQREGVASSIRRESDVPQCDNSDISRKPSTSRSTRNKNRHAAGTSDPVIAIDVLSPENGIHSSNEDSSDRALQLEADLKMALEMQENEYNKMLPSTFGSEEMDPHYALAMQHAAHAGGRPAYRPASRGPSVPNLNPNPRQNASRNSSNNRGFQEQASTSSRPTRPRGQFHGRSRTLSSTVVRRSMFSPNMNIDTIMEALDAIYDMEPPTDFPRFNNDMEMPNDLLNIGRDFNENDYEMLLALDDNNHQHGGATHFQINNLPQSTVQTENLQECSICLETPAIGETIRHLPCLHRFHKDCIDEWLRRKTSCPVCKLSVT